MELKPIQQLLRPRASLWESVPGVEVTEGGHGSQDTKELRSLHGPAVDIKPPTMTAELEWKGRL